MESQIPQGVALQSSTVNITIQIPKPQVAVQSHPSDTTQRDIREKCQTQMSLLSMQGIVVLCQFENLSDWKKLELKLKLRKTHQALWKLLQR